MKERPILFKGEMVRAIIEGRKTETRRPVKQQSFAEVERYKRYADGSYRAIVWDHDNVGSLRCPYGGPGDRLWVRETWRTAELPDGLDGIRYAADNVFRPIIDTREAAEAWVALHSHEVPRFWRPSIHMPRWACRLMLEVVSVRLERLHDITEEGAKAEGAIPFPLNPEGDCWTDGKHVTAFEYLWGETYGWAGAEKPGAPIWGANPWVWVGSFKRVGAQ